MEVIFILLPLALLIAGVMLALFIWAVRSGQYDDLETPAYRILFDDDHAVPRPATEPGGGSEAEEEEDTRPAKSPEQRKVRGTESQ